MHDPSCCALGCMLGCKSAVEPARLSLSHVAKLVREAVLGRDVLRKELSCMKLEGLRELAREAAIDEKALDDIGKGDQLNQMLLEKDVDSSMVWQRGRWPV